MRPKLAPFFFFPSNACLIACLSVKEAGAFFYFFILFYGWADWRREGKVGYICFGFGRKGKVPL